MSSRRSKQNKVQVDEPDEDEKNVKLDFGAIMFLVIVVWLLLFFYGASIRGMTKLVERDALKKGHVPSSFNYALWFIFNSVFVGIPGFLCNITIPDPFEGVSVVRETKALGLAHSVHDKHFQQQPVAQQRGPQ